MRAVEYSECFLLSLLVTVGVLVLLAYGLNGVFDTMSEPTMRVRASTQHAGRWLVRQRSLEPELYPSIAVPEELFVAKKKRADDRAGESIASVGPAIDNNCSSRLWLGLDGNLIDNVHVIFDRGESKVTPALGLWGELGTKIESDESPFLDGGLELQGGQFQRIPAMTSCKMKWDKVIPEMEYFQNEAE